MWAGRSKGEVWEGGGNAAGVQQALEEGVAGLLLCTQEVASLRQCSHRLRISVAWSALQMVFGIVSAVVACQLVRTVFQASVRLIGLCYLNLCVTRRVLVLDQGMLVESGEPHVLLQHNSGIFSGMVAQTGPSSSTHLKEVARIASINRVASRAALQLHQQQQLRLHSEVLGRQYNSTALEGGQWDGVQQHGLDAGRGGGDFDSAPAYVRTGSEVSRYGFQVGENGAGCGMLCTIRL